jgi:hypothetical protein
MRYLGSPYPIHPSHPWFLALFGPRIALIDADWMAKELEPRITQIPTNRKAIS